MPGINNFLRGDKVHIGGFNINIDCACSLNAYFKGLENSDYEGVELYAHISKSVSHIIEIDLYLIRSNGLAFSSNDFSIDLKEEKTVKCKMFNNLFDTIDKYYDLMKKIIKEEYLPAIP